MNKKGILLKALCFLGLMAAAYLEFCASAAFIWAPFRGFGNPSMEYTTSGIIVGDIVIYVPFSLLLLILILRIIIHYRRKEAIKYYFYDILFCAAAVGLGFLAYYFLNEPREIIMHSIIHMIYENGWLKYPVP